MKKIFFIVFSLFFCPVIQAMYHLGHELPYTDVSIANRASIPLELTWVEIVAPDSHQQEITRTIEPGQTIEVKIGELGGYYPFKPAKISYKPIDGDPAFKQEFTFDLPSSPAFAFTAVRMADIVNNIWVPGIFKANDRGDYTSFQYANLQHPSQWEKILLQAGKERLIEED